VRLEDTTAQSITNGRLPVAIYQASRPSPVSYS